MPETPIFVSKIKFSRRLIPFLAAVIFGAVAVFNRRDDFSNPEPVLDFLSFWGFLALSLLNVFTFLKGFDTFLIFKNRIEISSLFGVLRKAVHFEEIEKIYFRETANEEISRTQKWCVIQFSGGKKYEFSEDKFSNFLDLKNTLPSEKMT